VFILLNGPLGIGKSTLAEALAESIDHCAMLDGDCLVAVHPPPVDELEYLHSTIALLVGHHRQFGYRHFVINHLWRTAAERQSVRAIDEREFELRTFAAEREVLMNGADLGEPFDVSAPPQQLVASMLRRLSLV
jgi:energy-coupling factor transporter ATP-binding protein EcfA2